MQANLLNTIEKDSTWRLISGPVGIKIPISYLCSGQLVFPCVSSRCRVIGHTDRF